MRSSKNGRGEKGTYGPIASGGGGGGDGAGSRRSSPRKKVKNDVAKKPAKRSRAKEPPKSRHRAIKPNRNSIKERVASAAAASTAAAKNAAKDTRRRWRRREERRTARNARNAVGGRGGRKGGKNGKKRVEYRMTLSERNNDAYLRLEDVPWYNADAANDGAAGNGRSDDDGSSLGDDGDFDSDDDDAGDDDVAKGGGIPKMPSERVLRRMDDELASFGAYVRLTPSELDARRAFLDHVAELAASQFDGASRRGVAAPRRRDLRGSGGRDGNGSLRPGAGASPDDFEDEEIRVAPFGSFATQEVCTFASDVDMCLWGVVKGAAKPERVEFTGDIDDDDCGENGDDEVVVLGGVSECPLLTESSLLRTMDAINSAAVAADESQRNKVTGAKRQIDARQRADEGGKRQNDDTGEGGDDCLFVIDRGVKQRIDARQRANEGGKQENDDTGRGGDDCLFVIDRGVKQRIDARQRANEGGKRQNDDAGRGGDDCLFFIDRAGEGARATSSVEVIDLSTDSPKCDLEKIDAGKAAPEGKEMEGRKAKAAPPTGHFQFSVDSEGIKELGGEMEESKGSSPDAERPAPSADPSRGEAKDDDEGRHGGINSHAREGGDERSGSVLEPRAFSCTNFRNSKANLADRWESESCGRDASDEDSKCEAVRVDENGGGGEDEKEVVVIESDVDDEGDDDSADKMSAYYARKGAASADSTASAADKVEIVDVDAPPRPASPPRGENRSPPPPATPRAADGVLELSVASGAGNDASGRPTRPPAEKQVVGPTGKTRARVLSALQSLTRQLRRSSFTHTIECRSRARVPIINCGTRTGFEGDIAIGGHNGVDTSGYAADQVGRFESFATIVLFLKVLMAQQGFDKPFTGGLGSYKLYVLVAYHIECHLENGGMDRPSEVLISLLFRYGRVGSRDTTTNLELFQKREDLISSDGGSCDLAPVHRLGDCVDMFGECHARLLDRIFVAEDNGEEISYLSGFVDCFRLREARETSVRRARLVESIVRPIPRDHPGKVSSGRRVGKVFSKGDGGGAKQGTFKRGDFERGPRGGIVPRRRPDLEAERHLDRESDAIRRGTKNRKNNKKQKRDEALSIFASRHSI